MNLDLLIINAQVMLPQSGLTPGVVGVKDGRIATIGRTAEGLSADEVIDCGGLWLLPGVIDPHVHFGFGSPDTDFETESRNAALGGTTTAISFHRSKDIRDSFDATRTLAESQTCIDIGFHFGITSNLHVETLKEISERFGVSSYKLYMMYKGAAGLAQGFTDIDDGLLFNALRETAKIPGAILGGLIAGQILSLTSLFNPVYSDVMLFAAMALILIFRPQGLMGVEGRA